MQTSIQVRPAVRAQAGVIALRSSRFGTEVLLVTRRCGSGWTIPKGCCEQGRVPADTARREALEEAGVDGPLSPRALGTFDYEKLGLTCRVDVFTMEVAQVYPTWVEDGARVRAWFAVADAARLVGIPALARMLQGFGRMLDD
jgi:phosphohistidine phosphatase